MLLVTASGHKARLPRSLFAALLFPALAACGVSPPPQGPGTKPAPTKPGAKQPNASRPGLTVPREAVRTPPLTARALALPGLEGVIGAGPAELARQFGKPRLDVTEGDARKLQFTGTACVLDIYLYPTAAGREPVATYVDARRASDGLDVDRAACVAALRGR
jgi:hypothetical protein